MSMKFIALLIGCAVTIGVFIVMCFLMSSVNPDPLPTEKSPPGPLPRKDMFVSDTDIISPSLRRSNSQQNYYSVTDDYNSLILYTVRRVIPPLWPPTPEPPPKEEAVLSTQANESTSKVDVFQAPSEVNETVFVIDKRSVDNFETHTNNTDSIILKLIDDSGQFNVEIKIRPNDASTKKVKIRKFKSKDMRNYSMSLKTKSNDLFKISELAKNTVIHVKPNDSVSINEYDDHLKLDNQKIRQDDEIQGSIVNLINDTTSKKPEELAINKDSWPIAFSSKINKRDLFQKSNNTRIPNVKTLEDK